MTLKISHKNTQKSDLKKPNSIVNRQQKTSFNNPYEKFMYLQRSMGNQAVGRLLSSGFFHDKLKIGKLNDKSEQEAERVADMVMNVPGQAVRRQVNQAEEKDIKTIHILQKTQGRNIIRREQVSPVNDPASETLVPESSGPINSQEGLISELTDRELALTDRWLDQSRVGVEALNGRVEHDLDVITRAVLCRRIPLEELLGPESDPGLCILEGATREDPRYQLVRQQVERGLRIRACGLVHDRGTAIERNRQLLRAEDIVEVRNTIGLSRESLIDEEFVCAVAMWQMLQGLSGNDVDGIVGPQTARTIGEIIEREAEELEEHITEAEAEGEEIGQDRDELARLRAVAERFLVFATPALVTEMTAIVLSEGTEGQAETLAWVYYNILREQGVEGMRRASAGRYGSWYPGWVRVLRGERLPRYNFEKAQRVRRIVERVFAHREANPFPGLINHGNIDDINGRGGNRGDTAVWRRARRYYWAQERGEVRETLVGVLMVPPPSHGQTQFVFDSRALESFFLSGRGRGMMPGCPGRDERGVYPVCEAITEITRQHLREVYERDQSPPHINVVGN